MKGAGNDNQINRWQQYKWKINDDGKADESVCGEVCQSRSFNLEMNEGAITLKRNY